MVGRSRFLLVLLSLPVLVCTGVTSAWAQCVPEPEVCDGVDNDCNGAIDNDVYGWSYSVFQQPSLTFAVTPIQSGGTAAEYYGYETLVPRSSNTPDGIEREDKLVLFLHEAPDGTTSLGLIFDQPIPEGGGGISTATGGHAEIEIVDAALLPVVMDDASDTYGAVGGTFFEWDWLPGHTDGGVLARANGRPFACVTITPLFTSNINGIYIVDGASGELVPFDSTSNPITICSQLCCTPTNGGVETCDGVDNDCDTEFDEGLPPRPSECGTGVCAATGVIACVDGVDVDSCQPGQPTGADDDCNGVDENCNGTADENYQPTPTTCGVGACANEGWNECHDGAIVDTCEPLASSTEVCDGADNDCDGATDEDLGTLSCGTGGCANEVPFCVDGQPQQCTPLLPGDEVCDGQDNDCDESVDEDTYGVWFSVSQQPFGGFAVLPVQGAGDAAAYYGYDTGTVRSSNTPDGIEREDALVLYMYQEPDGDYSLGLIFDEPVPEGGGISTATGGAAALNILDAQLAVLVRDDPDDVLGAGGTYFEWSWGPGHTDGAVVASTQPLPFCFTVAPIALDGIDSIAFLDGATMRHIALDSTMAPITICAQLCCTPTNGGVEICDGVDNDCDFAIDEDVPVEPTDCGVGVCARDGELVCRDGAPFDTCVPGEPTGTDDNCNGDDEDCDETADEEYVAPPTACGTGACANEGLLVCVDGATSDTCVPLAGGAETCNAVDDDCDGLTDEEIASTPTECGVGACAATGELVCTDGQMVDTCTAGTPGTSDASCDGRDDDCDGETDEEYVPTAISCGVGGCRRDGTRECVDGAIVDTCVPGTPTAEVCDGVDNDCDRQTDEGLGTVSCGIGACFVTVPNCRDGQLQECEPGLPQPESCDGRDNDCDGDIDEDTTGIFFSVFQQPSQTFAVTAIAGPATGADYYGYGTGAPLSSNTPDGLETEDALTLFVYDEPDDGYSFGLILDEPELPGGGISTASGGRARLGVDGRYTVAVADDPGDTYPVGMNTTFEWRWGPGTTDGALLAVTDFDRAGCLTLSPLYFEKIYDINMFDAATGEHVYFDSLSNPITICSQLCCAPSGDEVCDGLDNDCDGQVDEDLDPRPVTCGQGVCLGEGFETCVDGQWVSDCVPGDPEGADDDCDFRDNDCDGETDEEYVPTPITCGTGVCEGDGHVICVDGTLIPLCEPGMGSDELCNGLDDDCDGATDEGFGTETCGAGACEVTIDVCANGQLQECVPLPGEDEICDGRDNDCDGEIDEGTDGIFYSVFQQPSQTFSVTAANAPGTSAVEYYGYDSPAAPRSSSTPDGLEVEDALVLFIYRDDLGQSALGFVFDEPALADGGISTATGGAAQLTIGDDVGGILVADDPNDALGTGPMGVDYSWQWNPGETDGVVLEMDPFGCVTVTPRAFTGINRILFFNGSTMEHIAFDSTSNTITICTQVCCAPTGPEVCNALDDDCDGLTDNVPPRPTECGEGACAATGEEVCLGGEWVDTCEPGTGTPEECNLVDDDCDGATDEDLPVTPLTCGEGACAGTGERRCVDGEWVEDCEPSDPQPEICDGLDNDCDGATDEDFGTLSCGVGACYREVPECVDGVLQECVPGAPEDELCNGLDDDCDGEIDEGAPAGTYYQVVQGAQAFPVQAVDGVGSAAAYYNYGGGLMPNSSATPDDIEKVDTLVLFVHEDLNGVASIGAIFDEPIVVGGGTGMSDATGGSASLQVVARDAAALPLVLLDDPSDTFELGLPNSAVVTWTWNPGNTDGGMFGPFESDEWCVDLYPGAFQGIDAIEVVDGAGVTHIPLGSLMQMISICKVSCCVPSDEVCDGQDNDCDELVDEDLPTYEIECGVGDCLRTGTRECVGGEWVETCVPGEPCAETCDGHDNDCDGATDEDLTVGTTTCGEGACESTGEFVCIDGEWVDTCEPGEPWPTEICGDQLDNDCDGESEEDCYCIQHGLVVSDEYTDANGASAVATFDENARWTADIEDAIWIWESYLVLDPEVDETVTFTRSFFVPEEADAFGVPVGGILEIAADNGYTVTVNGALLADVPNETNYLDENKGEYSLFGLLQPGLNTFEFTVTNYGIPGGTPQGNPAGLLYRVELWFLAYPADEICDGIDNDCDGFIDEGMGELTCGLGACENTVDACWHGVPQECVPGEPGEEVCDGIDNDCDGLTDEYLVGDPVTCGEGACANTGRYECVDGEWVPFCEPLPPGVEECNGVDDDCDGLTDEDLYGEATECGSGACAATGQWVCVDGEWVDTCTIGPGTPEECNGIDDDCDGLTDEDLYGDATECGVGACAADGRWVCVDGEWVDTCVPGDPEPEICDSLDNDCDGLTDEDLYQMGFKATQGDVAYWIDPVTGPEDVVGFYQYGAPDASSANTDPAVEASQRATWFLYRGPDGSLSLVLIHDQPNDGSGGQVALNVAGLPAGATVQVADDPTAADARDTYDLATGDFTWGWNDCCTDGAALGALPEDLCVVITPERMLGLNGIDVLTQGLGGIERLSFPSLTEPVEICAYPLVTTCGEGVCGGEGEIVCVDGEWVDTCQPGTGSDEVCDAIDNDCDGLTDEDLYGDETECGEGACAATGRLVCENGEWVDTCEPGPGLPEECNGVDDDCDGLTDEDLWGDLTSCGEGACGATGEWVCRDGEWVDTCVPGDPLPEECNGVDDDCDGLTDEDLYGDATECGVGACAATGQWVCVDGEWVDTCVTGYGTPEECNGIDDDCDGLTDEDLYGDETQCGAGACAATGRWVCENGEWVDTCVPGPGSPEECNLIDDDCDGLTDEDLHGGETTCGEPPCVGTGELVCVNGEWVDTCVAPEGGPEDCNELDDDCDGLTDEGCDFKLCEFVASGSEQVPSPSYVHPADTRAGSLEFNFNGAHGYDGTDTDFPWAAGFVTLRNGAGAQVEQVQVNRTWYPPLDENGCTIGWPFPQCWLWPEGLELVEAFIPTWSTGSNSGFDDPGDRVEVSGGALIDYSVGELMDNSHETMVFTFTDPMGLDTAQMVFRGRFDWDLDGLDDDDVMIALFRRNVSESDYIAPFVAVVAESATEITLSVNVKEAIDYIRAAYDALGFFD